MEVRYTKQAINFCTVCYEDYIVKILKKLSKEINKNINFGFQNFILDKNNINISANVEQIICNNLIKEKDITPDTYIEKTDSIWDNKIQFIRLINLTIWSYSQIDLDYSICNTIHVSKTVSPLVANRVVYFPALFYEFNPFTNIRNHDIITHGNFKTPRRVPYIEKLKKLNLNVTNIENVFTFEDNLELFKNTKIIINIHAVDHHGTFEELRCLPALLCGCIIISEDCYLKEYIPYHEYIVWTSLENFSTVVKIVYDNYEFYYDLIFNQGNLKNIIDNMRGDSENRLLDKLKSL